MALQKAIRPIGVGVRTEEEVDNDARLLARLEEHLPQTLLVEGVRNFLRGVSIRGIEDALGPPDFLKELLEVIRDERPQVQQFDPEKTVAEARAHYEQVAREMSAEGTELSPQWVEEEVAAARHELVRHWVDLLHSAKKMWGFPVKLDELFRPIPPPNSRESWFDNCYIDRREALYAAVALEQADMRKIAQQFAESVRSLIRRQGILQLPLQMDLTVSGDGEFMVVQRQVIKKPTSRPDDVVLPNSRKPRGVRRVVDAIMSIFH